MSNEVTRILSLSNPYEILGISSNSNREDIIRAYRGKAKFLHPDRNPDKRSTEAFQKLNQAKESLLNPGSKTMPFPEGPSRQAAQPQFHTVKNKKPYYYIALIIILGAIFATLRVPKKSPLDIQAVKSVIKFQENMDTSNYRDYKAMQMHEFGGLFYVPKKWIKDTLIVSKVDPLEFQSKLPLVADKLYYEFLLDKCNNDDAYACQKLIKHGK